MIRARGDEMFSPYSQTLNMAENVG